MNHLSRRSFAQLLGTAALAGVAPVKGQASAPALRNVRLSANENPYGPSPAALEAMRNAFAVASRYPDAEVDDLASDIAKLHGVADSQVVLGAGSSEILKLASVAFTSPSRALVMADPTFEALAMNVAATGATIRKIPLDASYAHDLGKMLDATRGAGLVYICNPNNPTATITADSRIREFLAAVPAETTVLVDEAYHHYVTSSDYASVTDLIPKYPNLVVTRTFSKIFGLAGVRVGYCVAHPSSIAQLRKHQAWDPVNVFGLVAARTSLQDTQHVAKYRRINADTKSWLRGELASLGYRMLPSEANFVMIDIGREIRPLIGEMRTGGVAVGRVFPALPKHMRVTIGTPDEMKRFMDVFAATMKKAA
jgi:histidinol-phosphate aminotransferase